MPRAGAGCYSKHQCETGNGKNCGEIVWFFTLSSSGSALMLMDILPSSECPRIPPSDSTPSSELFSVQCSLSVALLHNTSMPLSPEGNLKTLSDPLQSVFSCRLFHAQSVVFQLHSPSSSSRTPALLALKGDLSCFALMFPRFYLLCYLDILIWFWIHCRVISDISEWLK